MKKLLIMLLTTVYAIAALGITLHFYYCCHKLSSVSVSAVRPDDNCKKMSKGCCTNKTINVKLTTDQVKSTVHNLIVPTFSFIPTSCFVIGDNHNEYREQLIEAKNPLIYPPPNLPSRQIRYCIFRI